MFVVADEFAAVYRRIKERALQRDCSVAIFVAADVDAACAARIIKAILNADFVRFEIHPVNSFSALRDVGLRFVRSGRTVRTCVRVCVCVFE